RFSRDWSSDVCSSDLRATPSLAQDVHRGLSRKPPKGFATYEVEMQVKDDLPTVTAAVGHDAIACLPNAQLLGQLLRHPQHVPGQLRIAGCEIGQGCDVLPRDDQHVNRGLGVDVAKCDH